MLYRNKSGLKRFIRRGPVGVGFHHRPVNYPLLTSVNSIVPALMAGNSVLLKASAQVPLGAFRLAFESAGLPEGVLQNLFLSHEDTERIVNSGRWVLLLHRFSPAGQWIERAAAGTFAGVAWN